MSFWGAGAAIAATRSVRLYFLPELVLFLAAGLLSFRFDSLYRWGIASGIVSICTVASLVEAHGARIPLWAGPAVGLLAVCLGGASGSVGGVFFGLVAGGLVAGGVRLFFGGDRGIGAGALLLLAGDPRCRWGDFAAMGGGGRSLGACVRRARRPAGGIAPGRAVRGRVYTNILDAMKKVALIAVALLAAGLLWKGEAVFNGALRGWLAVNGVHGEVASPGGNVTIFWFEGGREHEQSVILLHGVGGNALSSWFRLLPALAKRYHVIAPDLFFANMPDLVDSGYDIQSEKALTEFLIHHLGLQRVALLGLSFGAWPAMQAAVDLPGVVNGVILVSPFGPDGAGVVEGLRLDPGNPGKDFYYRIFQTPPPAPELFLSTPLGADLAGVRGPAEVLRPFEAPGRNTRQGHEADNLPGAHPCR